MLFPWSVDILPYDTHQEGQEVTYRKHWKRQRATSKQLANQLNLK